MGGDARGVGVLGRHDHHVLRVAGLQEQAAAGIAVAEQLRGASDEGEGLLGRSVARRQQLLVELEERDGAHRSAPPVQRCGGADDDPRVGEHGVARRHLAHRLTDEGLELLAHAPHAGAEVAQRGRAARLAHAGALGTTAAADEDGRIAGLAHGGAADLAARDLSTRAAGQQL